MKIVLIGAGSESFGRGQIADMLQHPDLQGCGVRLTLVDIDKQALALMLRVAKRLAEHAGSDIQIDATTDRREALVGADMVVVAVSVKRWKLWEQDYRIPLSLGFKHVLGENGGPGAIFHALRSFELILPICRDMEEICPKAKLLNFTNPEARVLHAIRTLTNVEAYGFCHGVFGAIEKLVHYTGRTEEQLDIVSAGMNHFFCILKCTDRETGDDLLPKAIAMASVESSPHLQLFARMARIHGLFLFPSDDHIGEYLSFGSEFHGLRWSYGVENYKLTHADPPADTELADYAEGTLPADAPRILRPSGESPTPVIADILVGRENAYPAVNVLNDAGYIENLPRDMAVEVPCRVTSDGDIQAVHVGELPRTMAAMLAPQCEIVRLLTEAYRTGSKKMVLQAMLLDPVVDNITRAEELVDTMLGLQSEFLPELT
jgi:alpha-galactosidase